MSLASFIEVIQRDQYGNILAGPDGKPLRGIIINPAKPHVRGFWLTSSPAAVTIPAGATEELTYTVDTQGHFEWVYLIGRATVLSQIFLRIRDNGTNRDLMNREVNASTIVGSAKRPFRLPEPYFLNVEDAPRTITVSARNASASPNTLELVMYGRRWYHNEAPPDVAIEMQKKFRSGWRTYSYWLTTKKPFTLAANASGSEQFESSTEADTEIFKLTLLSTGAFTFRLRERDTNRTLSNGDVSSTNGWGTAEFPFVFADTYLLQRDRQLIFEATNVSGASNTIFATLSARRLQYK